MLSSPHPVRAGIGQSVSKANRLTGRSRGPRDAHHLAIVDQPSRSAQQHSQGDSRRRSPTGIVGWGHLRRAARFTLRLLILRRTTRAFDRRRRSGRKWTPPSLGRVNRSLQPGWSDGPPELATRRTDAGCAAGCRSARRSRSAWRGESRTFRWRDDWAGRPRRWRGRSDAAAAGTVTRRWLPSGRARCEPGGRRCWSWWPIRHSPAWCPRDWPSGARRGRWRPDLSSTIPTKWSCG